MELTKGVLFWIPMSFFVLDFSLVDADSFVLVADLDNGTIYKGSISQGLADLAPLPLSGVIRPVTVDFDPVDQMVYWTDVGQPSPKISKAHLDGSGQVTLINELHVPAGLALDLVARMVYWTDEVPGHIARIPMDGSSRNKEVIVENIVQPRGIIIYRDYGHIYWADSANNGIIERATLDGFNRITIVQDHMGFPSGLAIDHQANQLYWCDSRLKTIERRDLSGYNREVLIDLTPNDDNFIPFDLVLYNDNVYWSDWGAPTLLRASKGGAGARRYGPEVFQKAGGIHIYEDVCDSNPCLNRGTCTHLATGFTCQCAPGYGGHFCQSDFCDSSPCKNGGTCTSMLCQCVSGYEGSLCHLVVGCKLTHDASDIVTMDPYQLVYLPGQQVIFSCPDGYELQGSAVWFCQSDYTWTESQAECTPLDSCEGSPCVNGGTCISRTAGFSCQCAPGCEGTLCHLLVGCELNPDVSDIVTIDPYQLVYLPGQQVIFGCPDGYELRGSAECFCQSDYTWTDSQAECIPFDICESSPCMNGGTCTSLTDGVTCQCAPGYEGNVCDLAKQGCFRPPKSNHMTMSETEPFFQPGEDVVFTCENDYIIQGSNDHSVRLVCRAEDGSWSGGETKCVINNQGVNLSVPIITSGGTVSVIVFLLCIGCKVMKWKKNREPPGPDRRQPGYINRGFDPVDAWAL